MAPARSAASQPSPLLSVSVVSHGDNSALRSLLDSLARHEEPRRLQLIVTDNLGHDLPPLDASTWHSLTLLRNDRPQGYARNHNLAFARAQGQYFCVLNPDVVLVESVFGQLIRLVESSQAHIVAPWVVDSTGHVQDSFRSLPSPLEILGRRVMPRTAEPRLPPGGIIRPDWIAGIILLMRGDTFSKLGGFDDQYRMYFEDVDLCSRARLLGLSLAVDSRLRVQHDARRASRRPGWELLWHLHSAVRFFTSGVYRQARSLRRHA